MRAMPVIAKKRVNSRWRPWAFVMLFAASCAAPDTPKTAEPAPPSTRVSRTSPATTNQLTSRAPDRLLMTVVSKMPVRPGGTVKVTFSGGNRQQRGGYFWLKSSTGKTVALLWTDKDPERNAGGSTNPNDWSLLAYPLFGKGPDTTVIPNDVPAGSYQLCLANSGIKLCVPLLVR